MATPKKPTPSVYQNLLAESNDEMRELVISVEDIKFDSRPAGVLAEYHPGDAYAYNVAADSDEEMDRIMKTEELAYWETRLQCRSQSLARREKNLKKWASIKRIIKAHQIIEELPDGDIVIRIKRAMPVESLTTDKKIYKSTEVDFAIEGDPESEKSQKE